MSVGPHVSSAKAAYDKVLAKAPKACTSCLKRLDANFKMISPGTFENDWHTYPDVAIREFLGSRYRHCYVTREAFMSIMRTGPQSQLYNTFQVIKAACRKIFREGNIKPTKRISEDDTDSDTSTVADECDLIAGSEEEVREMYDKAHDALDIFCGLSYEPVAYDPDLCLKPDDIKMTFSDKEPRKSETVFVWDLHSEDQRFIKTLKVI